MLGFAPQSNGFRVQHGGPNLLTGTLTVDDLTITNSATIGNDLTVVDDLTVGDKVTFTHDVTVGTTLNVTGNTTAARFLAQNDTPALPGHSYANDPDTGLARTAADSLALACAGITQLSQVSGLASFNGAGAFGSALIIGTLLRIGSTAKQTIGSVNDAITNTGTSKRTDASAPGYALASTPTIAAGTDGDIMIWIHEGANPVTVSDNATIVGTLLSLGAATRVLGNASCLMLQYRAVLGLWVEICFIA